jgi:hypothetical protein
MRLSIFAASLLLPAAMISAQVPVPPQSVRHGLEHLSSYSECGSCSDSSAYNHLFIAKDRFEKVKLFYQKLIKKGDSLSASKDRFTYFSRGPKDSIHVTRIEISQKYDSAGTAQGLATVNAGRSSASKVIWMSYPGVFQDLGQLVGKFGHTEPDFKKLVDKYLWICFAYYKEANAQGTTEDTVIYKKHYKNVFNESTDESAAKTSTKPMTEEDAEKMNDKMRDLAAAGDMNAIMQMNMQMAREDGSIDAAAHGSELHKTATNNDNWKEWVQCLEELNAAAYGTLIKIREWNECNPKTQHCPHGEG